MVGMVILKLFKIKCNIGVLVKTSVRLVISIHSDGVPQRFPAVISPGPRTAVNMTPNNGTSHISNATGNEILYKRRGAIPLFSIGVGNIYSPRFSSRYILYTKNKIYTSMIENRIVAIADP